MFFKTHLLLLFASGEINRVFPNKSRGGGSHFISGWNGLTGFTIEHHQWRPMLGTFILLHAARGGQFRNAQPTRTQNMTKERIPPQTSFLFHEGDEELCLTSGGECQGILQQCYFLEGIRSWRAGGQNKCYWNTNFSFVLGRPNRASSLAQQLICQVNKQKASSTNLS